MEKSVLVNKLVGETPLEALERYRATRPELAGVPMTYAGRLDPMAHGQLLILIGDECKNKDHYLAFDKEYEVEVVFGIKTDTYDALGLAKLGAIKADFDLAKIDLSKYVGKFEQEYPAYSSKTVGGKQLHELARAGELPEEMPSKNVEIYSVEPIASIGFADTILKYSAAELHKLILGRISLVKGDFRQEEIKKRWAEVLGQTGISFKAMKIRVKCSSGTYMRSLAERLGGFALDIHRTQIFFTS